MKELIYEPIRKIILEFRPKWKFSFEGDLMKIKTNGIEVDNDILEKIQNSGYKIFEIKYQESEGIFFSIIEKSLDSQEE
ncbi:MAG: hypothetical protein ACRBB2_05725 [Nitrosopumilus sp.]